MLFHLKLLILLDINILDLGCRERSIIRKEKEIIIQSLIVKFLILKIIV